MSCLCLEDYYSFLDENVRGELETYQEKVRGFKIQHINSTAYGGGVAELLNSLIPAMQAAGLDCRWSVLQAENSFFQVTKSFHNALHGKSIELTEEMIAEYQRVISNNQGIIDDTADIVVIHDQQPLGLINQRKNNSGCWIWYCHVDITMADKKVWEFLSPYIQKFDFVIVHLEDYLRPDLHVSQQIMPPGIDPLSAKNRDLLPEEREQLLASLDIEKKIPFILQISRFDRLKDPLGVIEAFRIARKGLDVQLVLAGGSAVDDPEGAQVLAEVKAAAAGDPGIKVITFEHTDGALEINALQRSAAVVIQKSLREGFGLTVTEALWKGRPVVGSAVGGIKHQIIHEQTGLLVDSIPSAANALRRLLQDPVLAEELGRSGKEHVRKNFILPVYLLNWLKLIMLCKSK